MQDDGLGKISGLLFRSQNGGAILANTNWFREPSGPIFTRWLAVMTHFYM